MLPQRDHVGRRDDADTLQRLFRQGHGQFGRLAGNDLDSGGAPRAHTGILDVDLVARAGPQHRETDPADLVADARVGFGVTRLMAHGGGGTLNRVSAGVDDADDDAPARRRR